MLLVTAFLLAVKLSLLPVWTSQPGPPDCKLSRSGISSNHLKIVARFSYSMKSGKILEEQNLWQRLREYQHKKLFEDKQIPDQI